MQSTIYLDCLRKVLSVFANIPNAHTMCHINFWKKLSWNNYKEFGRFVWNWKLCKKSHLKMKTGQKIIKYVFWAERNVWTCPRK